MSDALGRDRTIATPQHDWEPPRLYPGSRTINARWRLALMGYPIDWLEVPDEIVRGLAPTARDLGRWWNKRGVIATGNAQNCRVVEAIAGAMLGAECADDHCEECARSFGPHYAGPCEHGASLVSSRARTRAAQATASFDPSDVFGFARSGAVGKGKKKNKPGSRVKGPKPRGAEGQRGRGAKGGGAGGPSAPSPLRPSAPGSGPPHSRDTDRLNAMVVICGRECARERGADSHKCLLLVETVDPADRAHEVRVGSMLIPAHVVVDGVAVANRLLPARPRRYPASQVNGAGLAVDSQFDAWHEARKRLASMTLMAPPESVPPLVLMRMRAMAKVGLREFERLERPRTRQKSDDPAAERAGSRLLRAAKLYRENGDVDHGGTDPDGGAGERGDGAADAPAPGAGA